MKDSIKKEPYAGFRNQEGEIKEYYDDFYTRKSAEKAGAKYNPLIDALTESIVSEDSFNLFLEYVKMIESGYWDGSPGKVEGGYHIPSMDYDAYNKDTKAAGLYHFTPEPVDVSRTRAENLVFTEELTSSIQGDPREMPEDLQSIMFIANLLNRKVEEDETTYFGKKGREGLVDDLAKKAFIDNDMDAMNDLYYTLHHTMLKNPVTKRNDFIPSNVVSNVNSINLDPLLKSWNKSKEKQNFLDYYNEFK